MKAVDGVSFHVSNKFSGTVEGRVGALTLQLVRRELDAMASLPLLEQLETIVRVADVVRVRSRDRRGAS